MLWPDANPSRRDGKPATNHLRYGTAYNGLLVFEDVLQYKRALQII
jgi:hypothetical protein